jgi:hypothetical protein
MLALVNRGAIKSNSEMWHNFQGFPFSLSQTEAHNSMSISQEMSFLEVLIFKIFWGHISEPPRELAPLVLELLGSQFILNALPPPPKE